jgi:hypothetical protein
VKKQTKSKAAKANTRKPAAAKKGGAKKTPQKKVATTKQAPQKKAKRPARDPRLPAIGSVMTRKFKDCELKVTVADDGFRFKGKTYKSLSALARHIVGYQISGFVFFGLAETKQTKKAKK